MNGKQSNSISVVMTAYNAEKNIAEAIESVLHQSLSDFEFIIVNDGSTDSTRSIITSFNDNRIHLIDNERDYVKSLNLGLKYATGKYIARMEADIICHVDRFKIQHSFMEEHPEVTICNGLVNLFGKNIPHELLESQKSGIIENPLIDFLSPDFVVYPATFIRNSFIKKHDILYEDYAYAEELQFWAKVGILNGLFFIDSQPFVHKRITDSQPKMKLSPAMFESAFLVKKELLNAFCNKYYEKYPSILSLCESFYNASKERLVSMNEVFKIVYDILNRNRDAFKES